MILVYHNIYQQYDNNQNVVSIETFRKQMSEIKRRKYQVVKITEYNPNDNNQIVLRFDDGLIDIMNVLPILRKYKFPFHVYIVGDWFGKNGFIGENEVAEIKKSGGTLEWHGNSHTDFTTCTDQELLYELTIPASIKALDKNGFNSVAYPFWKNDERVRRMIRRFFKYGCAGNITQGGGVDPYALDGIKMKEGMMYSDKIVKFIDVSTPTWPCNFRCHYCYVGQHLSDAERGVVRGFKYSPDEFEKLISRQRLGGTCVFNFCAFGETLILPQNVEYCIRILKQGHFLGIVSNMTITQNIDKLLALPQEYLSRLFFKCSFHYLELKKRGLLDTFTDNVNRAWRAGASITIEITPSDELEEYIDEVKEYSMKHFGALPHITIARNELMPGYVRLTKHSHDEYEKIWSVFDSELFRFKTYTWEKKVRHFCYAGKWCYNFDLGDGGLYTCSHRKHIGDFGRGKKLKSHPVCKKCPAAHCFNSHAWLAWGACPEIKNTTYAAVRDRLRTDGTHWLHPRVRNAFSQHLGDNNKRYGRIREFIANLFA